MYFIFILYIKNFNKKNIRTIAKFLSSLIKNRDQIKYISKKTKFICYVFIFTLIVYYRLLLFYI